MYNIKELQELLKDKINSLGIVKKPERLYEPVEYILSLGGKRLRPTLVLMSCNLFSKNIEDAIPAAIAIEVFHNFTLVHDDIMDEASVRRGKVTIHNKWNQDVAILSGDAMSILAYKYLAQSKNNILPDLLKVFTQTALEVCEGQQYDMDFEDELDVTAQDYLKMIELKTSVLIACAMKMGAIAANADDKDAMHLYNFGKYIGMAFQLRDDYLDVYGDSEVFGKKTGGDIVSNKKTYLLINALQKATGSMKEDLISILEQENFDPQEKVKSVKEIYNKLDVQYDSTRLMNEFYQKGIAELDSVSVSPERKEQLYALASSLLSRDN